MSGMRIWFGPAGDELLGATSDGTPVLGDENGVTEMTEITEFIQQPDDATPDGEKSR